MFHEFPLGVDSRTEKVIFTLYLVHLYLYLFIYNIYLGGLQLAAQVHDGRQPARVDWGKIFLIDGTKFF